MIRWIGTGFALIALLAGRPAHAAVDMSGEWRVEFFIGASSLPNFHASVTQSGTSLTMTVTCSYISCVTQHAAGTIDPDSGVFSVEDTGYPAGALVTQGVVAPDSYTFTGSVFIEGNPEGTVAGSRCGNGVLDAPEQCDDGNLGQFDCCNNSCLLGAPGSACTSDGDYCTSDVCDGGGTCTHDPAPAGTSCAADDKYCTIDTCDGAGGCAVTAFRPVGTLCDYDAEICTREECDADGECVSIPQLEGETCDSDQSVCTSQQCIAGTCTTIDTLTCATCEDCDPTGGCVVQEHDCESDWGRSANLGLRDEAGTTMDRTEWSWGTGLTAHVADLGADTAAAGAQLCVIDRTTASLLAAVDLPAGADWTGSANVARYAVRAPDGSVRARIKQSRKGGFLVGSMAVKAKGAPASIAQLPDVTDEVIAELRHGDGRCWATPFDADNLRAGATSSRRYRR